MWTPAAIVAWLVGLGIGPGGQVDVELIGYGGSGAGGAPGVGNLLPPMPDRVAMVAPTGGQGLTFEGVMDRPEFALYIRGPQGDSDAAFAMAYTADELIVGAQRSVLIDGTYLLDVTRAGGRPAPVDFGMDGDRMTLSAAYVTHINDQEGHP